MKFGMKSLLVGITALGLALYLLFAANKALATVALAAFWVLAGVVCLGGVVYGSGKARAFCLGALIPTGGSVLALVFVLMVWLLAGPWEIKDFASLYDHLDRMAFTMRAWSAGGAILALLAGAVSAAARWACSPKREE